MIFLLTCGMFFGHAFSFFFQVDPTVSFSRAGFCDDFCQLL